MRFPESSSFGVKPVSKEGTERLVRAACKYALEHGLPSVTLVHKGNIMKFTEGGFKKWGYELAEREFGDAIASGKLVIKTDSRCILAEYVIDSRRIFGGGYLEFERRLHLGSVGCHGRRYRNCSRSEHQLQYRSCHFEATHGTAPNIAGKDVVNPCSLILSAVSDVGTFWLE